MGKQQQTARYFQTIAGCILGGWIMQSCSIYEDFSDCPTDEFQIYIKVVDVATGKDITKTGKLEDTSLYIFDQQENFIKTYHVTASQIAQRIPVTLSDYEAQQMIISAWGNLTNRTNISEVTRESVIENLTVSLLQDPMNPGYNLCPDDFFFGSKKINRINSSKGIQIEEIVLTQKNAKLHITVRGLDNQKPDDYYFKIINNYNGYNFHGTPIPINSQIKEKGVFNAMHDYISPDPYLLIHSINPEQSTPENSIWIELYKEMEENDLGIIKTNQDTTTGNYLTLTPGKTTNVLIVLSYSCEFLVKIEVTPWDEIFQWSDF